MPESALRRGAVAGVAGALWIAGLFAAAPLAGGSPVSAAVQAVILASPGALATAAIELLGKAAQPLLALGLAAAVVAALVAVGVRWERVPFAPRSLVEGAVVAFVATLAAFLLAGGDGEVRVVAAAALAVAPVLAFLAAVRHPRLRPERSTGRRAVLRGLGLAAAAAAGTGVIRAVASRTAEESRGSVRPGAALPEREKRETGNTTPTRTPANDGDTRFDFGRMPARITPVSDHYVIDINFEDPDVNADRWSLDVGGAAGDPYSLSYEELTTHADATTETVTMVCISNQVGGNLIGTARWTGVPLGSLVDAAAPDDDVFDVITRSPDGYSEAIPIDVARREEVLIAFAMNGRSLTRKHGFPARLLIPGRYGMKSTKWVNEIELTTGDHTAYWEQRGWVEEAEIKTLSYVREGVRNGDEVVLGGVAYAGLRGIERVEVSVDGGATWTEAELEEAYSPYAWRRWRHAFEAEPRTSFEAVVRAYDGTGERQYDLSTPPHPDGATGWHARSFQL